MCIISMLMQGEEAERWAYEGPGERTATTGARDLAPGTGVSAEAWKWNDQVCAVLGCSLEINCLLAFIF